MDDRLTRAEEQIAHLTRTVEDLSDVMSAQSRDVTRLTRLVSLLMEREAEREMQAGGTIPLADQKPPHY
ncbi:SlyX protein [Haematobacter massiliensis]|uniref:SlyX family protein n=1 Tax=Haematobacter massiliensis TaxID=195105 RepID=A0A086Y8I7_9RHOB|nr:SlyX family protein [Haematobacter massiliensis]KFI30587.1 SlyX family protein [Haematobacter massiliensis]OWJ71551.1 SlyX protein [Haematobacter massiliensis]OWJ87223.1 SlyX protein [Haematobacter massiliensis]QBJ25055.1 SlyX family protein [Haematobacter massiliensis]